MLWFTLCKAVFSTIMTEEIRPFVFARKKTMVVMLVVGLVRDRETLSNLKGSLTLEIIKNIYCTTEPGYVMEVSKEILRAVSNNLREFEVFEIVIKMK